MVVRRARTELSPAISLWRGGLDRTEEREEGGTFILTDHQDSLTLSLILSHFLDEAPHLVSQVMSSLLISRDNNYNTSISLYLINICIIASVGQLDLLYSVK